MSFEHKPNFRTPQREEEQMIYGIHPVMEAVKAGKEMDRIFIHRGARGDGLVQLKNLLKESGILWQEVPIEKLNRFTRKNHQDVVAFISPVDYQPLEQVVPTLFEQGKAPLILLLDRITDVRNFGAIARSAECAGVHAIVIPHRGAATVTADAIRTSAGALNRIPVCRVSDLRKAAMFLQESGLLVAAATEKGKEDYFAADFSGPLAIVMGSEEDGISPEMIKTADKLLRIPMLGNVGSLNVTVAAGIVLFETVRQRLGQRS